MQVRTTTHELQIQMYCVLITMTAPVPLFDSNNDPEKIPQLLLLTDEQTDLTVLTCQWSKSILSSQKENIGLGSKSWLSLLLHQLLKIRRIMQKYLKHATISVGI